MSVNNQHVRHTPINVHAVSNGTYPKPLNPVAGLPRIASPPPLPPSVRSPAPGPSTLSMKCKVRRANNNNWRLSKSQKQMCGECARQNRVRPHHCWDGQSLWTSVCWSTVLHLLFSHLVTPRETGRIERKKITTCSMQGMQAPAFFFYKTNVCHPFFRYFFFLPILAMIKGGGSLSIAQQRSTLSDALVPNIYAEY